MAAGVGCASKNPKITQDSPPCLLEVPSVTRSDAKGSGCAEDALRAVLGFWELPVAEVLRALPQDRGVMIPEIMSALRAAGVHVELVKDSRDLSHLKATLRQGLPVVVLVAVTPLPDLPISPMVRSRGLPHYMVAIGFDDASKVFTCMGLGEQPCQVPYRTFISWWKRTGFPMLKISPAGS